MVFLASSRSSSAAVRYVASEKFLGLSCRLLSWSGAKELRSRECGRSPGSAAVPAAAVPKLVCKDLGLSLWKKAPGDKGFLQQQQQQQVSCSCSSSSSFVAVYVAHDPKPSCTNTPNVPPGSDLVTSRLDTQTHGKTTTNLCSHKHTLLSAACGGSVLLFF